PPPPPPLSLHDALPISAPRATPWRTGNSASACGRCPPPSSAWAAPSSTPWAWWASSGAPPPRSSPWPSAWPPSTPPRSPTSWRPCPAAHKNRPPGHPNRCPGGRSLCTGTQQQGLELPPLEGGVHRVVDQREVGHQGGGLPHRVILAAGDEKDVLFVQQGGDVFGRAGQAVVGGDRHHHRPAVAPHGL